MFIMEQSNGGKAFLYRGRETELRLRRAIFVIIDYFEVYICPNPISESDIHVYQFLAYFLAYIDSSPQSFNKS